MQPVFGLSSTFGRGFWSIALNEFAPCTSCGCRLKLVPRRALIAGILFGICLILIMAVFFIFVFVPSIVGAVSLVGLWGLLALPLLAILLNVFGLLMARIFHPFFREVIVV